MRQHQRQIDFMDVPDSPTGVGELRRDSYIIKDEAFVHRNQQRESSFDSTQDQMLNEPEIELRHNKTLNLN